jgi:hypothetical protein
MNASAPRAHRAVTRQNWLSLCVVFYEMSLWREAAPVVIALQSNTCFIALGDFFGNPQAFTQSAFEIRHGELLLLRQLCRWFYAAAH